MERDFITLNQITIWPTTQILTGCIRKKTEKPSLCLKEYHMAKPWGEEIKNRKKYNFLLLKLHGASGNHAIIW